MIEVTPDIRIHRTEISEHFIRAAGPGGQNVNKVETAVQLRFDARNSPAIDAEVYARLKPLAGRRMNRDGIVVITARRFRNQADNRRDALDRLVTLIRRAAEPQKTRRPTAPSRISRQRRLDAKRRQANVKRQRAKIFPED